MLIPIAIDDNHAVVAQHGVEVRGIWLVVHPVIQERQAVAALHGVSSCKLPGHSWMRFGVGLHRGQLNGRVAAHALHDKPGHGSS